MPKFLSIILLSLLIVLSGDAYGASKKTRQGRAKAKTEIKAKTKPKAKSRGKSKAKAKTSADVRREQQATQREIRLTEQQIRENDAAVDKNLKALGLLQGDIDAGKQKVAVAAGKVKTLQGQIDNLQGQIAADEQRLAKMRGEYLKAVRKMQAKRKNNSTLAFIFSSGSFHEAARRMRYLRQFSDWREKKSGDITARVRAMKQRKTALAQTKSMHDRALAEEQTAQAALQKQYVQQDAIVVQLKQNGRALKSRLARKQAEANALKGQIAALIAQEQAKAEQERREKEIREQREREAREAKERQLAAERREREERLANERREREQREAELAALDKQEKAQAEAKRQEAVAKKAQKKKQKEQEAKARKQRERVETKAEREKDVTYAEARRRRPRQKAPNVEKPAPAKVDRPAVKTNASSAGGGFASMRGSLPRPVTGGFKVTSRFGRHSLPDLPDVVYDNPGIDAEVASGASAQAVYGGKVSGVYMIPGYNTVVIVNHDGYYTVYGNISAASVKVGDTVRQGQGLGRLAPDENDPSHSLIHFEVWKNRDKMDPLSWIR